VNRIEQAVACFAEGFSCSQAVFSTYAPQFGLDRETALKVAGPFGGGMGGMGGTCGAVTGAFMVIGLKHGRTSAEDVETKEQSYRLVREFASEFESRHGSILCKELLGCAIDTPEKSDRAKERGLFTTICPSFVQDAAEIIEKCLALGGKEKC
jgi:C_GCAxxG_C_C family probable redox protein